MKVVYIPSVLPKEDIIALREKTVESFLKGGWVLLFVVLSCAYRKITYKNKVFLAAIIIASVLTSIPSSYAVLADNSQEKKASVDDQAIDLSDQPMFSSNELLIRLKSSSKDFIKKSPKSDNTGITSLNALNKKYRVSKFEQVAKKGAKSNKESQLFNWYRIAFEVPKKTISKKSAEFGRFKEIMESYKSDPSIDIVEPNYIVTIFLTPDDPYYSSTGSWGQSYSDLWGIRKINPEPAWNQATGSSAPIVAGIDTGVDRNHEDLKDNMWVNTAEISNNGIDDDSNGYVDDYYGWDWANNDNDPMDDHGHGTHTAGTIAAVGNNSIGVVGVNWKSRIMALKFLNSGGSGFLDNGIKALQYAADMGARVSSNSWGCTCNSQAMDDAVQYEHDRGMVMVAAAGNSNADALDFSPASADGAITVAASDYNDAKASFSNWGQKIDVIAPGVDILSTRATVNPMCTASRTVGTNYCRVSGTSMATPHAAGLAALILSKNPNLTNEEVRQIIRTGAVDLGVPGKDSSFGYGRINANNSISISTNTPLSPIITNPKSRTVVYGTVQIKGSISGPNFSSYKIEAGAGREPSAWMTLVTSTTQVINATLGTANTTQLNDGLYIFRVTATDKNGKTYQFQVHDIEVDNFDMAITSPVVLVSQGIINVSGTANTKNGLPFANYKLEWGIGSAPALWLTQGINLVNNGIQPVNNSKLATWDMSNLTHGQVYMLRLTITASTGTTSQYSITVTADKDVVKGWPKRFEIGTDCFYCEATPTIADIDNDGSKEVIIAAPTNKLYIFRKDGTDFPGFPLSIASGEFFYRPPNVADLDGDGKKEIVVASIGSTQRSKVYIIRSDGTFYPGWPNPAHLFTKESGDGTPTIADLDDDGKKELIIIDPYYKVMHAYHLDGTELTSFPKTLSINDSNDYPGAPLISDLDKDGKPEIAYGYGNKFYLFDNKGNLLPGWPFAAPPYNNMTVDFRSTAASGDIDGDGNLEVLAIGQLSSVGYTTVPLYAWKINGSLLPNWPMPAGQIHYGATSLNTPSVADVDNDDRDEVVVGLSSLSIFDLEGAKPMALSMWSNVQPAVSDIDGDGNLEFAGLWSNRIEIGNYSGSIYWKRAFLSDISFSTPAVFADLDNNGKMEFGAISGAVAYLWELPNAGANPAKYDWPMFSHDPARTGRLVISATDAIPPTTTIVSPTSGSTVSGIINVTDSASDNVGVSKVELYRDGILVDAKTSSPFTFAWDTTKVTNGDHTLQSKAYDAANNAGASAVVTVTVSNANSDNTAPTVSITSPLNGVNVPRRSTVTITASASDNVGVTKVEFYVNGALQCSGTGKTCNWNVPGKPDATYSLQAKAYDAAGNVGYSAIVRVISK